MKLPDKVSIKNLRSKSPRGIYSQLKKVFLSNKNLWRQFIFCVKSSSVYEARCFFGEHLNAEYCNAAMAIMMGQLWGGHKVQVIHSADVCIEAERRLIRQACSSQILSKSTKCNYKCRDSNAV